MRVLANPSSWDYNSERINGSFSSSSNVLRNESYRQVKIDTIDAPLFGGALHAVETLIAIS